MNLHVRDMFTLRDNLPIFFSNFVYLATLFRLHDTQSAGKAQIW